ncbi:MAG: hypothetical protein DI537_26715 [Stutzerimonas stutzeri]|nr:MAG: hypothetical protein DI537_26715 [Stutzerimonas stutzeri]
MVRTQARRAAIAMLISGSVIPFHAACAQTGSPVTTPPDNANAIADIVVTAQRREERLQSVPVSVTAMSSQMLTKSGVTATSDLQIKTPGLVWSTATSVPTPFLRGIGSRDNSAGNENGVATYLDGIYIAGMPGGLLSLPNIERVEVLKGPQGTLFGRNANGGLIQIITKDPPSKLSGTVAVGYANYNTVTTSAYIGAPLTQTLSADLSVYYLHQSDGWGHNLTNGADVNLQREIDLRSKLMWKPGPDTKIVLAGDYSRRHSDIGVAFNILPGTFAADGRCAGSPFPVGYPSCSARPSSTFKGSIYDSQSDLYGTTGKNGEQKPGVEQGGVSLTGSQELGFATLRSMSSYRFLIADVDVDQEGSSVPISNVIWHQRDRSFTQELQLAAPVSSRLKWIVGAFYLHRRAGYDPLVASGYGFGQASALAPAGQYGAPPAFGGGFTVVANVTTDSIAGYGQATYDILPQTNLTVGLRYTSDHQSLDATQTDARGVLRASASPSSTFSKLTWRFSLDHKFGDNILTYASYNRGFKAGLYSTFNASGVVAKPETLDAFEIGAKTDLLNRRLRLNAALFHYSYDGVQLPVIVPGGTQTINAAKAKLDGLDVDVTAVPLHGLTLSGGASMLFRAKYSEFLNGPFLTPSAFGNTQVAADLSDNRMIRAPKFTGNMSADYRMDTGVGQFNFNVNLYRNSGFFWTPDDNFKQPAYNITNAQIGFDPTGTKLNIRIWAKNLFATHYYNYVGPGTSGTITAPGDPRTFGITGTLSF